MSTRNTWLWSRGSISFLPSKRCRVPRFASLWLHRKEARQSSGPRGGEGLQFRGPGPGLELHQPSEVICTWKRRICRLYLISMIFIFHFFPLFHDWDQLGASRGLPTSGAGPRGPSAFTPVRFHHPEQKNSSQGSSSKVLGG